MIWRVSDFFTPYRHPLSSPLGQISRLGSNFVGSASQFVMMMEKLERSLAPSHSELTRELQCKSPKNRIIFILMLFKASGDVNDLLIP